MPLALGGERPKSSESFWPGEKEARRLLVEVGVGGGEFSLLDIWNDVGVESSGVEWIRVDVLMKCSR